MLTDSQGRRVDFKNTVIIMTSNVGARLITEQAAEPGLYRTGTPPAKSGLSKRPRTWSWAS